MFYLGEITFKNKAVIVCILRDKAGKRMQVVDIDIKELTPYEKNPRKNDDAVQYVAESIKQFGFKVPIVIDKNNVIVAGHTRYKAAKKLKLKTVPCLVADDLTDEQIKAFRLADNKVAEFSEWDFDLLELELKALEDFDLDFNLADFGFEDIFEEEEYMSAEEIEEDNIEDIEVPQEPKSKTGDIYQLGNHRLMCGDSTSVRDVEFLMDNNLADMVLTDPPYNVDISNAKGLKIKNDNMGDDEFFKFLSSAFFNLEKSLKPGGAFYIWFASRESINFRQALNKNNLVVRQELIWNKNYMILGRQDYHWKHEPCLYGWKDGAAHYFVDDRTQSTVIDEDKPQLNDLHPTMKPIKLLSRQIVNSSRQKEVVLDLFGGSGSTLIACEKLNRRCFMMEMDPKYVDVIIARWEEYTGEKAVLLNN